MSTKLMNNKNGLAMIVVLWICAFILFIFGAQTMRLVSLQKKIAAQIKTQQLFYLAEAGVETYRANIAQFSAEPIFDLDNLESNLTVFYASPYLQKAKKESIGPGIAAIYRGKHDDCLVVAFFAESKMPGGSKAVLYFNNGKIFY